jgi:hypothetical protein
MIRLALLTFGKLVLLFALMVGAIRSQPPDDAGLRAVLYAPDCAPPCFMGIYPGETAWDDAVERLRSNSWVATVNAQPGAPSLEWTWNGSQPAFLSEIEGGNHLFFDSGIVTRIGITTDVDAATAALTFGAPLAWYYYTGTTADPYHLGVPIYFEQRAVYDDLEIGASSNACPLTVRQQWSLLTQISMPPLPDHSRYFVSHRPMIVLPSDCR